MSDQVEPATTEETTAVEAAEETTAQQEQAQEAPAEQPAQEASATSEEDERVAFLERELSRARKEAAGRRVTNKEVTAERDGLLERVAELERINREQNLAVAVAKAKETYQLPDGAAAFLGDDPEQVETKAKELAEVFGSKAKTTGQSARSVTEAFGGINPATSSGTYDPDKEARALLRGY